MQATFLEQYLAGSLVAPHFVDRMGCYRKLMEIVVRDKLTTDMIWMSPDGIMNKYGLSEEEFDCIMDLDRLFADFMNGTESWQQNFAPVFRDFWERGEKTFCFGPNITTALFETDLPENLFKIQLPYPVTYFHYNDCPYQLANDNFQEPLLGAYLVSDKSSLTGFFYINLVSQTKKIDGGVTWLSDEFSVGMNQWTNATSIVDLRNNDKINDRNNDVFRLVINSLMYLNSTQATFRAKKRRLQPIKRKKKIKYDYFKYQGIVEYFDIRHNIVLNKSNRSAYGSGKLGRVVQKQFTVRGHWRNQAYGTGRKLRKIIWIEPFMKGPDDAELIHRNLEAQI